MRRSRSAARSAPLAALALAISCATGAAIVDAAPVLFPPLPDGRQEIREEGDVASYLAAWKAASLSRERAAATPETANQLAYDVHYYDLALTFTPGANTVAGTVRMKASVVGGPISTVDLDLYANMFVDAATSAGSAATWSRALNVLTLDLDRAYSNGETVDVTVTYHGNPTAAGYLGFQMVNGRQLIWSLSEAYGARTWWPCKDAPEDKADSVDVHFTCPVALTTVSNGTLAGRDVDVGVATTHWRERYPITTYLVSIAAYPYAVTDDWYVPAPSDSMLIRFHNYPESAGAYAPVQAKVKDMIAAYAQRFGEYPFLEEKYGHAQFQFGGGMEHQTCTSLGVSNESVVAHELTHQWWGDLVTCRDFHHIWLNEGFATYGEALWAEANGGVAAYMADIQLNRYLGSGTIYVPDASDESRVFNSSLSYNKGSWVLHMLRHVLGDATFFDALRAYYTAWGYQSATTEDFRDVCETVSGLDLDDFFQQWIYGERYPIYRASWTASPAAGGYDVTLTLEQTQSWQLFHMPVDVRIATDTGDVTFVVDNAQASEVTVLHVASMPTQVTIDPDGWILKGIDAVVANPSFDRSVLLVNGVDWGTYGSEITNAYTNHAFSGAYAIDFWDTFDTPAGGYPGTLPMPLGHGAVPPDVIGQYRNVIWVGNNFNGDLAPWQDTPILSYLRVGGNVLLMSRQGELFLGDSLRAYLGLNWTQTGVTISDCIATRPGVSNIAPVSTQSLVAVFDTVFTTPEIELLFRVSAGFSPSRGIGAVRKPAAGAGARPHGGRIAFLSGRPYRWNATQLQNDVTAIVTDWFVEPVNGVAVESRNAPSRFSLEPARPNPSSGFTTLRFTLPRAGQTRLVLHDVAGRRTRTLLDGPATAGEHARSWDGRDERGAFAPAGLYWAELDAGGERAVRRLVRVR